MTAGGLGGKGTPCAAPPPQLAVELRRGRRVRPWPEAASKIGSGVRSFQIRTMPGKGYTSFVVVRTDGRAVQVDPKLTALGFNA